MGLMTEIFAATPAELATLPVRVGASHWPGTVLASGITDLHLAALEYLLCGGDEEALYAREPEWVREEGPDGPWVMQLPADLARALARLVPGDHAALAARWAATGDLAAARTAPADLEPLLAELVALAQSAEAHEQDLYLWMSL